MTTNPGGGSVDPDVADGVGKAARALDQAGYAVEQVDPPAVEEAAMLWMSLVGADVRTALWLPIKDMVSPGAREFMEEFLSRVPEIDLQGYVQAACLSASRSWARFTARTSGSTRARPSRRLWGC